MKRLLLSLLAALALPTGANAELDKQHNWRGKNKITCLRCLKPNYPSDVLIKEYEGVTKTKVWINTNGSVTKVEIIESSGLISLDNAAMQAAKESTFYPITEPSLINIEYLFQTKK